MSGRGPQAVARTAAASLVFGAPVFGVPVFGAMTGRVATAC